MECIPKNSILEFRPNALVDIRRQYNLDAPGDLDRAIDVLEAWIEKQNHFVKKKFPRDYLERMLMANKGSIERAKIKLDKICTFRTIMPDFFGENLTNNDFYDIREFISAILPKQTENNYRVYIMKQTAKVFSVPQMLNYYRFIVKIAEYLLAYDYSNGLIFYIDYSETNLVDLIKEISVTDMRQIISIIMEGFGMRLQGIHLLTSSKTIEALIAVMKQLFSAKIGGRIQVHKDLTTLYEYIPKDIMPSEYGGKEISIFKLHGQLMDALSTDSFKNYLDDMSTARTDESQRQTDKFNEQYMGMPGSFRTLNVD